MADDNLVVQSLVAEGLGVTMLPSLVLNFMRHPRVAERPLRPVSRRKISAYVLPRAPADTGSGAGAGWAEDGGGREGRLLTPLKYGRSISGSWERRRNSRWT